MGFCDPVITRNVCLEGYYFYLLTVISWNESSQYIGSKWPCNDILLFPSELFENRQVVFNKIKNNLKKNTEKVKWNKKMQTNQCQHAESEIKIKWMCSESIMCVESKNCICILLHHINNSVSSQNATNLDKLCHKSSDWNVQYENH